MSKKKNKGEVFTPKNLITFMLDETYNPESMNYILEPGCGDSRFIIEIIKRIIKHYDGQYDIINDKISKIYGFEIDENNINNSKLNIENYLVNYNEITTRPTIIFGDALINDIINNNNFDYIIGNPPYVRIHNLDKNYLTELQEKYSFLKKGMVDLYYAFFELYKKSLSENGILCFITPNSYLYNTSGEFLINSIYTDKVLYKIYDFKSEKMFNSASTYTCITVLKKNSENIFYNVLDKNFKEISTIQFKNDLKNFNFLKQIQDTDTGVEFSKLYKVKTGFATLSDKIFIIDNFEIINNLIRFKKNNKEYFIEKNLTKKCIKASKFNNEIHRVIFPYKNVNGKNEALTEDELFQNYPNGFNYLNDNKAKLLSRDKGKIKKENWYLWGRTQGINNTFGKKIIISPLFLDTPFSFIDENVLIYSGYYIISENFDDLFKNESFITSVKNISKPISSGWFSLQKKILDNVIINK